MDLAKIALGAIGIKLGKDAIREGIAEGIADGVREAIAELRRAELAPVIGELVDAAVELLGDLENINEGIQAQGRFLDSDTQPIAPDVDAQIRGVANQLAQTGQTYGGGQGKNMMQLSRALLHEVDRNRSFFSRGIGERFVIGGGSPQFQPAPQYQSAPAPRKVIDIYEDKEIPEFQSTHEALESTRDTLWELETLSEQGRLTDNALDYVDELIDILLIWTGASYDAQTGRVLTTWANEQLIPLRDLAWECHNGFQMLAARVSDDELSARCSAMMVMLRQMSRALTAIHYDRKNDKFVDVLAVYANILDAMDVYGVETLTQKELERLNGMPDDIAPWFSGVYDFNAGRFIGRTIQADMESLSQRAEWVSETPERMAKLRRVMPEVWCDQYQRLSSKLKTIGLAAEALSGNGG